VVRLARRQRHQVLTNGGKTCSAAFTRHAIPIATSSNEYVPSLWLVVDRLVLSPDSVIIAQGIADPELSVTMPTIRARSVD
jgi:hypothetical protein